ncbi:MULTISPECIES: multidrug efflux SMR transporter [unclassified Paludibacterium]|uniref:DMT family transporter n=1 Tax=unclassified Paludibacterium TaxID=2618429 RepID=UPI001C04C4DD|nr:multidrug efflux SMR transporter [Paludibacterium sp. B53371]BEV72036.1 multidrug efflux SMR transporter [Paludibacterium sp. THUN1379]
MSSNLSSWLMLAGAIAAEVTATSSLKMAQGFTRFWPSLVVVIGYALSFWLLARVMQRLELGLVYAVWCGVGMAVVAAVGVIAYGESLTLLKVAGIVFVTIGVIMLSFAVKSAA